MSNQLWVYDFTLANRDEFNEHDIIPVLKDYCKKWGFQFEVTDDGYEHYQGRISLMKKKRITEMMNEFKNTCLEGCHLSPTSKENATGNKFYSYTSKGFTRKNGPWKDTDIELEEVYIPRQYRNLTLRHSQQQIINWNKLHKEGGFDDRTIHCIYDANGNHGKSTIASYCELFEGGIDLPFVNDAEKIVQSTCNICMSYNLRNPSPIFVDLPRATDKQKLNGIYSACEQIKKGKLYDVRNKYKKWWIDSPLLIVCTNKEPDVSLLSRDRWKIWTYHHTEDLLIPYEPCIIDDTYS